VIGSMSTLDNSSLFFRRSLWRHLQRNAGAEGSRVMIRIPILITFIRILSPFVTRIRIMILIGFVSQIVGKNSNSFCFSDIHKISNSLCFSGIVKNSTSYSGATAALQRRCIAIFYLSLISFVVKTNKNWFFQKFSLALVKDFVTYRHKETDNVVRYSGATAALFSFS